MIGDWIYFMFFLGFYWGGRWPKKHSLYYVWFKYISLYLNIVYFFNFTLLIISCYRIDLTDVITNGDNESEVIHIDYLLKK